MRKQKTSSRTIIYVVLILGSILMLMPMAWMGLTSLKTFDEVLVTPPKWIPADPQWNNYTEAFTTFNFARYLMNSIIITVLIILGTLISSTLAAYGFACLDFKGKGILFGILLSAMMLPAQVTVIPLFQLFTKLGWVNTYYPLIVPSWLGLNVFAIFLLRQFFKTIPRDYIEAARIDGASELRILLTIFVPLSKPALLTVAVFTFIWSWNDLWGPLIYLHDDNLYTMPIGLLNFIGIIGRPEGTPWHLVMAVAVAMIVPIVILFFIAQKKFIEGIATTGLKG